VHVAHHFWSLIEEKTPLAAYTAVEVPTLILCGTRSPAPSRAITRLLAEALPHARHRTISNAGHMSPITHAAEVNGLIVEHLQRNRASTCLRPPGTVAAEQPIGHCPHGPRGGTELFVSSADTVHHVREKPAVTSERAGNRSGPHTLQAANERTTHHGTLDTRPQLLPLPPDGDESRT
jgi:hypothetical protein